MKQRITLPKRSTKNVKCNLKYLPFYLKTLDAFKDTKLLTWPNFHFLKQGNPLFLLNDFWSVSTEGVHHFSQFKLR